MGVIFNCLTCGGQAGEFDLVDEEYICSECQNKALRIGIKIIKLNAFNINEGERNE